VREAGRLCAASPGIAKTASAMTEKTILDTLQNWQRTLLLLLRQSTPYPQFAETANSI
jgi:hypothetical protein